MIESEVEPEDVVDPDDIPDHDDNDNDDKNVPQGTADEVPLEGEDG